MAEVVALIVTGTSANMMSEAPDDTEWRKRITSASGEAPSLVFFDNLTIKLDSAAVATALTSRTWSDRILGMSKNARLPIRCVWIATASNPRVLPRNLQTGGLHSPRHERAVAGGNVRNFRHSDLMTWVRANRSKTWGSGPASPSARRGSPRAGRMALVSAVVTRTGRGSWAASS